MQYVDVVSCLWLLLNTKKQLFIYRRRRPTARLLKVPIRDIFFYLCKICTKCRYEKTKTEMNLLFFSPSYRALNVQLFGNYSAKNFQNRERGKRLRHTGNPLF